MSEMASAVVLFDREKLELDRLRAELREQRTELEAAKKLALQQAAEQKRLVAAASLTPNEISLVRAQYNEVEVAMAEVSFHLEALRFDRQASLLVTCKL